MTFFCQKLIAKYYTSTTYCQSYCPTERFLFLETQGKNAGKNTAGQKVKKILGKKTREIK